MNLSHPSCDGSKYRTYFIFPGNYDVYVISWSVFLNWSETLASFPAGGKCRPVDAICVYWSIHEFKDLRLRVWVSLPGRNVQEQNTPQRSVKRAARQLEVCKMATGLSSLFTVVSYGIGLLICFCFLWDQQFSRWTVYEKWLRSRWS